MFSHTEKEEHCSLIFYLVKSVKGEAEFYSSVEEKLVCFRLGQNLEVAFLVEVSFRKSWTM